MKRALVVLLLSACAPLRQVYRPVEVHVPVGQPCVKQAVEKPDFATAHISASDDVAIKTRAVLIELNQRKAYEAELEAQAEGCM